MKFFNRTEHPATLMQSQLEGDRMIASMLVRIRHQLDSSGELAPPPEEHKLQELRMEPIELDEYGQIEPDLPFPRSGTDLIVVGDAVSADGEPVGQMEVRVQGGPYDQRIVVSGDRHWTGGVAGRGLVPSEPELFERMPIALSRAFGGKCITKRGGIVDGNNPSGKGMYTDAKAATNRPLPNLESPAARIKSWEDRPEPVSFGPYPSNWGLRLQQYAQHDGQSPQIRLRPENGMFDRAHPLLSGKTFEKGTVKISGMSPTGSIQFTLPECPVQTIVHLGRAGYRRLPKLEEIFVDLRFGLVDLSYRKVISYLFRPHEIRHLYLTPKKATP